MPFRVGPMELILVLLIVLLVFGATKLPEIGAGLGKAIQSFREATRGDVKEKNVERIETKKTA